MSNSVMIKDAYVFYAKFKTPALKYKKEEDKEFPYKNKEYVGDFLLKAADLKSLKSKWKSSVRAFKETTELSASDFKKKYKVEELPPAEYKNEDGKYELIKFRKHASQKDGTPNDPPALFGYFKAKGRDKNGLKVTQDTLLGNGTLVNVQLTVRKLKTESGKDQQLDLYGVQVIDLIPYESAGDKFEDHDGDFEDAEEESEGFDDHDSDDSEETEDDDFE